MRTITLQERGKATLVPASGDEEPLLGEALRELGRRGVLEAVPVRGYGHLVTPKQYVGELILPFLRLCVDPKAPGLIEAADRLTLRGLERTAAHLKSGADGTEISDPFVGLIELLKRVFEGEGIPWRYKFKTQSGMPRGRLLSADTIRRFAARGMNHQVVSRSAHREFDPEFVSVIWTALRVAGLRRGTTLLPAALARVPDLLPVERETNFTTAVELGDALQERYRHSKELSNCLSLALAILADDRLLDVQSFLVPSGLARFRNLEDLWERVVGVAFTSLAPTLGASSAHLHAFRGSGIRLFDASGPELDPDVALDTDPAVIVDAKYKFVTSPDADDLYQLVAYVRRWATSLGALVFPTEGESRAELLGRSEAEGFGVIGVWLNPAELTGDSLDASGACIDSLSKTIKELSGYRLS